MSKIVRINEHNEIVGGQRYCYGTAAGARKASTGARGSNPRVKELWDRAANRYYYLGAGEVGIDRSISWWGRGSIVQVVEV